MTSAPGSRALRVRTIEIADPGDLAALLPSPDSLTWLRRGEGIVGWGVAARLDTSGADRFEHASSWWHALTASASVEDSLELPGTGLVCFGSFGFADEPGDSILIVPEVVVGRRGGVAWLTLVDEVTMPALAAQPLPSSDEITFSDGSMSGAAWESVVADAVARIGAGELDKVVLARDLVARSAGPIDIRRPLRRLAASYESCWTFHVAGLFGATPEMLVRRERGLVTSRVLAGTIRRTGDDEHDLRLAAGLARSSKDLEEHEYAVRSVADALAPYCDSMNVPDAPFVLHLPNVMHLATDVTAVIHDDAGGGILDLVAALHPSAAVGGTPTKKAVALIEEIEGMDRGRYAGPVGWMDAGGDGEFGIALRSAQLEAPDTVRLYAGCGIVADSDPEAELAESMAKFVPVRDALTSR